MAVDNLRGRLLVTESTSRPLVYYGAGPTASKRARPLAGNGDYRPGRGYQRRRPSRSGQLTRVTREQIFAWDPAIIIAQQPSFYTALQRDRAWRGVAAVAKKRIYLAPADPFGWIDDPPG